jgi:hypothetical protein
MKPNSDPEQNDALLDASLGDEVWQAACALIKAQALRTFHARQRVRQLVRWTASVAAVAVLAFTMPHWVSRTAPAPGRSPAAPIQLANAPEKQQHLTDEQLLASFPKGTCFIAEVGGKKQLLFLDPKVEQTYVGQTASRDN